MFTTKDWVATSSNPTRNTWGVVFLENPPPFYVPGEPELFLLALMYYPGVNYDVLTVGATFTLREGPFILGYGTVLAREDKAD